MPFIFDAARNCRRWVSDQTIQRWADWRIGHPHWVAPVKAIVVGAPVCAGIVGGLAALPALPATPALPVAPVIASGPQWPGEGYYPDVAPFSAPQIGNLFTAQGGRNGSRYGNSNFTDLPGGFASPGVLPPPSTGIGSPTLPQAPQFPVIPFTPTTPVIPLVPLAPITPDAPLFPIQPSTPVVPSIPYIPTQPTTPVPEPGTWALLLTVVVCGYFVSKR